MLQLLGGIIIEQTDAIQVYYRRGFRGKAPVAGRFSQFL